MKTGLRTLLIAALSVLAGTIVEATTGGLSTNLLELLLGAPLIVGGRHLGQELLAARKGPQGPDRAG